MCQELGLDYWGCPDNWKIDAVPERAIFCSQTLNLRSIRVIGCAPPPSTRPPPGA